MIPCQMHRLWKSVKPLSLWACQSKLKNIDFLYLVRLGNSDRYLLKFEKCLEPIEKEKLMRVSSNGPKVNLLFLQILGENRISTNLDTYSLHTTYNGFKWRGGTCLENGKSNVIICIKFSMNLQSVEKITKWHPKKWRYKIENLMDGLLRLFTCFSIW